MSHPRRRLLLAAVLLTALLLRLYGLNWGVPGEAHFWSYQPDEAKTFQALENAPFFHPYDEANGPAYLGLYGLHTLIGGLVGLYPVIPTVPKLKENPSALTRLYLWNRLLSVGLGVLTVWVLYLMARRTGLGELGVFSAIMLLAILPEAVLVSQYGRPQVLNTLLTLLFANQLCRVIDGSGGETAMAVWSVAAASSEYTLAILIVFGGLAVIWFGRSIRRWAIGLLSIPPLFFNVWMAPQAFRAALHTNQRFWAPFSISPPQLVTLLMPAVSATVLLLALLSIAFVARKPQGPVLLSLTLLIVVTYFVLGQYYARRFAPAYPLMCLGIGTMLDALPKRWLVLTLVPLLMIEPGLRTAAILETKIDGDTRTQARAWIEGHVPPQSAIGFENWFFMPHLSVDRYAMIELREGQIPLNLPYVLTGEFNSPSPDELRRTGFEEIYEIKHPHSAFGVTFNDSRWPEDMRYPNPSIYLFRRKDPPP